VSSLALHIQASRGDTWDIDLAASVELIVAD